MEKTIISSSTNFKKSTQILSDISIDTSSDLISISSHKILLTGEPSFERKLTEDLEGLSLNYPSKNSLSLMNPVEPELDFLPNPGLTKLKYADKKVPIYSNLYKIALKKNYILYEYAIKFQHDDIHLSTIHKRKVFGKINREVTEKYGVYLFTGNSMFATKEIKDVVNLLSTFKKFQYSILIQPTKELLELKDDPTYMNSLHLRKPEVKTILELIVKDILRHNPSLKFVKNLYGKKYQEKSVKANDFFNSISIMPGFCTKIMFLEDGIFLNVDIKNKILSSSHCLDLINSYITNPKNVTRDEMAKINKFFKGRTVETVHSNQRFKVEMVNFDKRASNYTINFENTTVLMTKYYKSLYDIDIEPTSPLILIKSKGKGDNKVARYYPPQLCLMVGLTDEMAQDFDLMHRLAKETKQNPEDKVNSINDIIRLVNEKKGIPKKNKTTGQEYVLKSCFEKKEEYGIDISEVNANSGFYGYMVKNPLMKGKDDKVISDIRRPFEILDAKKINYLCVYHKEYKDSKSKLVELFKMAGASYAVNMGKSEFKEVSSEDPKEWISAIEKSSKEGNYNLVIILLDDYLKLSGIYDPLKTHSMENRGYVTQVIVTSSLYGKNALSIVSNILLQVNSKIGGTSYKVDFELDIRKKNLMLVGVDSSHQNGQMNDRDSVGKSVIAMCASLNSTFTNYTHKKIEVEESVKNSLTLPIAAFLYEAVCEYFKFNKKLPGGIVIYRQGVSREQKYFLNAEIEQINNLLNCDNLESQCPDYELLAKTKIPFYYILVNKKTSLKFFECESIGGNSRDNSSMMMSKNIKSKMTSVTYQYDNPDPGLLVFNSITDPQIFEFYLQPQKVSQGTATPTNFHVAFGNLDCPELIPKLTYDLCYLYSNWRGPVRVPAPLKYAEKLAKTVPKLHDKVKNTLCYI